VLCNLYRDGNDSVGLHADAEPEMGPVTSAAVCLLSSIAAWLAGASFWWAIAGVLVGSVIPFTLIVILPTNKNARRP
jgi:hypothetical protein